MQLEEILIHMFYCLETGDLTGYTKLRAIAVKIIADKEASRILSQNMN
ncbi:hypothetical protein [Bdellovibrio sp. ZAP7]|nr:hypothetical protein [Bdellovibrio sp. ZAP7]